MYLCTGIMPYHDKDNIVIMNLLMQGTDPLNFYLNNKNNANCKLIARDNELLDVLKLCFTLNHKDRPTAELL